MKLVPLDVVVVAVESDPRVRKEKKVKRENKDREDRSDHEEIWDCRENKENAATKDRRAYPGMSSMMVEM